MAIRLALGGGEEGHRTRSRTGPEESVGAPHLRAVFVLDRRLRSRHRRNEECARAGSVGSVDAVEPGEDSPRGEPAPGRREGVSTRSSSSLSAGLTAAWVRHSWSRACTRKRSARSRPRPVSPAANASPRTSPTHTPWPGSDLKRKPSPAGSQSSTIRRATNWARSISRWGTRARP
jgi:hypothetical protein